MPAAAVARRTRTALAPALLAGGVVALGTAACDGGPERPREPSLPVGRAYADSALAWEQRYFYWASRVDFAAQQAAVRARVTGQPWTYTAADSVFWGAVEYSINPWLRQAPPDAPDRHSLFFRPDVSPGKVDASPDPRNLASGVTLPGASGQPVLAYVWLPGFTGRNREGRADSIQTVIRQLDTSAPCGWLLDLRRNLGGYTDAMVAGINPLLGDAPASATQPGYFGEVDRDNGRALFFVTGGRAGLYDPARGESFTYVATRAPYTLRRPGSPVALLVGPATASASEAITLGFRGGPVPYRSFGEPTYGLTTGPYGTYLRPDDGYLNITATIMFDRTGRLYGTKLQPDELVVTGPAAFKYDQLTPTPRADDPVIAAASAWLRQQRSCTGAPAGLSRAPSDAAPAAVAPRTLPGRVRPLPDAARQPRVMAVPEAVFRREQARLAAAAWP